MTWLNKLSRVITHIFLSIDWPLLAVVSLITAVGFICLYSAGYSFPWRITAQIRNIIVAVIAMIIVANVPVSWLRRIAIPAYVVGVLLLLATLFFGVSVKGATRWLNVGFAQIQPSEIMKIETPMLLATYFQLRQDSIKWWDYAVSFVILFIPVILILRQPDLGTSILVFCAGFSVIFFAGISWRFLATLFVGVLVFLPVAWNLMYDYQRQRVMTLLDPSSDPLGSGFHILQAIIAIGSGGFAGKGWMNGTQAHLDFIPERTSDFIFAVFSEEFGFVGNCSLIILYVVLICRTLRIAYTSHRLFDKLIAGSIATIFLMYSVVNMGMVSGVLPVVGVPLPFISYGGTAFLILGICCGILMAISAEKRLNDRWA
ncbi:MAG: rod shape-determining protein RodA [Burkholderiaceae bacterium]|nr:rod shape-determining protein RodA [Burkholderiaceae bacterium]